MPSADWLRLSPASCEASTPVADRIGFVWDGLRIGDMAFDPGVWVRLSRSAAARFSAEALGLIRLATTLGSFFRGGAPDRSIAKADRAWQSGTPSKRRADPLVATR